MLGAVKSLMPWWGRIAFKICLSRLPLPYKFWKNLSLFAHGEMNDSSYAFKVFDRHFSRYQASKGFHTNFDIMELGPGDTLSTALIACSKGASGTVLVDAGYFADDNVDFYQQLATELRIDHEQCPGLDDVSSLDELLRRYNAKYCSEGLNDLKQLPDNSIDFIFSHAVFEHIRTGEFAAHMRELNRILRPDGFMSHRIDFKDHLGGGLNNMRVSSERWESALFRNSGFYTNRLRASDVLRMMEDAGFECEVVHQDEWKVVPLARESLSDEFKHYADEDLKVSGMDIVSRHSLDLGE